MKAVQLGGLTSGCCKGDIEQRSSSRQSLRCGSSQTRHCQWKSQGSVCSWTKFFRVRHVIMLRKVLSELSTTCTALRCNVSLNVTSLWHHSLLVVNMALPKKKKLQLKFCAKTNIMVLSAAGKKFPAKQWSLSRMNRILKKIDERGSIKWTKSAGHGKRQTLWRQA